MTGAELRDAPGGSRVVLMCGIAGSGKTTYAQWLERDGYVRLSIDEEVWRRFGRYGLDYQPAAYQAHAQEAEDHLRRRLLTLIAAGRDVVVDFAFWRRSDRDRYKRLIEAAGGTWTLIYLEAEPDELRRRLDLRTRRYDANAAFPITPELLDTYLAAFEAPTHEGEHVITIGTTAAPAP